MFCEKCGSKLDTNSIFCANCGTKVNNQDSTNKAINDSTIILTVKPTFKFIYQFLPSFIVCLIILFIPFISLIYTNITTFLLLTLFLVIFFTIILSIILVITKKQYDSYTYNFYKTKVIYIDSFLNISEKEVKYKYIREVTMTQTFIQRLFNIGTIWLYTNAESGLNNGIRIISVENVSDVYNKIKSTINI